MNENLNEVSKKEVEAKQLREKIAQIILNAQKKKKEERSVAEDLIARVSIENLAKIPFETLNLWYKCIEAIKTDGFLSSEELKAAWDQWGSRLSNIIAQENKPLEAIDIKKYPTINDEFFLYTSIVVDGAQDFLSKESGDATNPENKNHQ